jgi:hypothetical protein
VRRISAKPADEVLGSKLTGIYFQQIYIYRSVTSVVHRNYTFETFRVELQLIKLKDKSEQNHYSYITSLIIGASLKGLFTL